jgi:hypothetical protein
MGLPITTEYAYDLTKLPPCPKCALEHDANFIRLLTTDAMYGCDAPRPGSKGIATILLHSNEITPAVAEWLKHTLSVGGTLVQVYSRMKRKERSMRLYHDRCMSSDNMVPARHHVQLYRKKSIGKQDAETWQVACAGVDLYRTYKPELVTIRSSLGPAPLVSWSKNHGTDSALCDIAAVMVQGDEIARVADRVKPKQGVSPLRRMPVPPSLAYPGRWLQGKAPCWSLTRIEVDQQGDVRCCRQGEPIGKVGDSRSAMAGRLAKLVRAIEMRRGCDTCAVASCPRCPFPGVSDDLYCKTMKKRGRIQRSLSGISLYSRLPLLVTQHKDRMAAE